MAGPYYADRVRETSTTTGTGTLNLDGAVSGWRTFVAGVGGTNTSYYSIVHQTAAEWEVGIGTVTDASPDTLSRTTILSSSNGGSAVSLSAGTKDVFNTLPAAYQQRNVFQDTWANRPSSFQAGRLFVPTNSIMLSRDDGGSWDDYGPIYGPFTAPVDGDFAWINQGSATVTTTNGGILLASPHSASDNHRIRKKSAPATPYTITAYLQPSYMPKPFVNYGLCFRTAASGLLTTLAIHAKISDAGWAVYIRKWDSPTAFNSDYVSALPVSEGPRWLRISDDGTNRKYSASADGINWQDIHSVGRTDFHTADEVGFFLLARNETTPNLDHAAWLLSWAQT